jgi:hypothetical protein
MPDQETTYKVALGEPLEAKIPPGDPRWPAFNASFENVEMPQFDIACAVFDGRPITTWHKSHWRTSANYVAGQHFGLDFDTEDERSTIEHLKRDRFIAKYGAFIYTTPTHRPDAPRARVIFLCDTPIMQARNYVLASRALLWMFGTADRQCKDAARFFYGGRPGACELEWLKNELPLTIVKDMIGRYQAVQQDTRRKPMTRTYPAGTADEQRVIDALRHIDAWGVDYDQWVMILMALHAEYGSAGLPIAESWADGRPGEIEQKWRSFHTDGNGLGRVGIGTVFALAKEKGWQPTL